MTNNLVLALTLHKYVSIDVCRTMYNTFHKYTSVSYTHLDVYKRQGQGVFTRNK